MNDKKMFGAVEAVFDLLYLATALVFAVYYYNTGSDDVHALFASMTLVLILGDSFHLIPRVFVIIRQDSKPYVAALGWGKMITSIGMTGFYLYLWEIGRRIGAIEISRSATVVIRWLAAIRVILCLLPKNQWSRDGCTEAWNLIRNLPFLGMGIMVGALFFSIRATALPNMWLAVLLSFACYLPVVLYGKRNPKIGMLMLPKSCMYLWIIAMGI